MPMNSKGEPGRRLLVLVLGMHRSGTSLITKAVEAAGADLGGNLMPAGPDNPKGFWEDMDVYRLNEAVFEAFNMRWDTLTLLPCADFHAPRLGQLAREAAELLKQRFTATRVYAVKDPRLCLLLPFWLEVADGLGIQCRFVVSARDPTEVAASLQKRNGFDLDLGRRLWLTHNYLILRRLIDRPEPKVVVAYKSMLSHPEQELARLKPFVQERRRGRQGDVADFIAGFVDPGLCHHDSSEMASPLWDSNITALHQCLQKMAVEGWSADLARETLRGWDTDRLEAENYWLQLALFRREREATEKAHSTERERLRQSGEEQTRRLEEERLIREQERQRWERERTEARDFFGSLLRDKDAQLERALAEEKRYFSSLLQDKDAQLERLVQESALRLVALAEQQRSEIQQLRLAHEGQVDAMVQQQRAMIEGHQRDLGNLHHVIAGLQETTGRYARDIQVLRDWHRQIQDSAQQLFRSLRWRVGAMLALPFARQPTALDHILKLGEDFRFWTAGHDGIPLPTAVPAASGEASLATLLRAMLSHPGKVLDLVSGQRIKNFWITLFQQDAETRRLIFRYYIDLIRGREVSPVREPVPEPVANELRGILQVPCAAEPVLSIIIPVYNQWTYTRACLESLVRACRTPTYEVILADDHSSDETIDAERLCPGLRVLRSQENLGFLRNCNQAAQRARGQFLVFLNNDTQVREGWLESLYQLMQGDERIAIAGSKLVYPDGTLQEAGGILWNDGSAWNYGRHGDPDASEYNYVKEVDYISGASLMVRRSFWEEAGGFDARFAPAYCEDSDLAFEARRRGYRVMYQPASEVVHFEGQSHGQSLEEGIKQYQVVNGERFVEKWGQILAAEHFPNGRHVFLARDRSRAKPHMLYVDHYVPHFDQDAGSRTAYQYLKLFRALGIQVTFLGDNFHRHEPYTSALQALGIEVLYGPGYAADWKNWFQERGEYFDYVFLNRPHIAEKYIAWMRRHSPAKIFYYGHDLHFLREQRRLEVEQDEAVATAVEQWKARELRLCAESDVVYFPSRVETELLSGLLPGKTIKTIPAYIFDEDPPQRLDFGDRSGLLFVGGFGHPPNAQAVRYFLAEVFPLVRAANDRILFHVVGSKVPNWLSRAVEPNLKVWGYVSDAKLTELYRSVRLVVVPLLYGAGVKGKVIEALYHGVPVVTTPIGAEGLPEAESVLRIAAGPQELAQAVLELYEVERELADFPERSRAYIRRYFSTQSAMAAIAGDLAFGLET